MDEEQIIPHLPIRGKVNQPTSDLVLPTTKSPLKAFIFYRFHANPKLPFLLLILFLWTSYVIKPGKILGWQAGNDETSTSVCVQEDPIRPIVNHEIAGHLSSVYGGQEFSSRAADWLGGAIRIPTEIFDDIGPVGEDPRWDVFAEFHEYLREAFPKVHQELSLFKVNTYGLLYTWQGSDPSLKPIMLMNHQDVVPVEPRTYSQWQEPPYSGVLKDGWIWGRGSCDDKRGLIGNLIAVETLLEANFKPKRTVVFTFGFDEESGGKEGARELGKYLNQHGPKEFAFILDEGGVYSEEYGKMVAGVSTEEKGYFDVKIKVTAPGGHSSIPPQHTTIGLLSLLLAHLESHPHPAHLTRSSTVFELYQCYAVHAPGLPHALRETISKARKSDKALKEMENALLSLDGPQGKMIDAILRTTQAVDIISGGVKVNALPEEAYALVNHRVSTDSSIAELQEAIISLFTPFTADRNLALNAFGRDIHQWSPVAPIANVTIGEAFAPALEPAPVTPTTGAAWRLLGGTIRSAYRDAEGDGKEIVVAPITARGNTDTRAYWDLSRNIYRYGHIGAHHMKNGVHTVNEAVSLEGFVNCIKFYTTLILNADEASSI
ncbi:hypothetical protein FRB93_006422 [Tulasnella sp. JGI-2019a]|nr:hypothetical protein FRB93_006422 [Tulasnella sp. JGI-2019a]